MTGDYSEKKWIHLYTIAMMDLQHALKPGRIIDTSGEIVRRIEILKGVPGLSQDDRRAIDDGVNGLRSLAKQESRTRAEHQRRAAQLAIDKLSSNRPHDRAAEGRPGRAGVSTTTSSPSLRGLGQVFNPGPHPAPLNRHGERDSRENCSTANNSNRWLTCLMAIRYNRFGGFGPFISCLSTASY
jgi:hypothetical protein